MKKLLFFSILKVTEYFGTDLLVRGTDQRIRNTVFKVLKTSEMFTFMLKLNICFAPV
jgi:hypothetical protein